MFSNLRQGSLVYILHKPLDLQIGTVTHVNSPLLYMQYMPNQTIDIKVDVNGESSEFKQLPSGMGITYYDNGKTIISDNKESISNEVLNMIKTSKEVIDSIPYHNDIISNGECILEKLNPELCKLKEQEVKITKLETKVESMEGKLDNIAEMLTKALEK